MTGTRTAPAGQSREAAGVFADLMALPPDVRRGFWRELPARDKAAVLAAAQAEAGSPFGLWVDDALGFVEDVLGENVWSKPREILEAITRHPVVAVPSCFSSSKTWSVARAALWFALVHPVGTARVVTTAPLWRQVVRQAWHEIGLAHDRAGVLPGKVDMAQYKLTTEFGRGLVVADGIAAAPHNEAAVQGLHAPRLLLLVDEAGGIHHTIGRNLRALLTSEGTQMIAIGNPPTDEEGSWFEELCGLASTKVIAIPATETPNLSGEPQVQCRSCPEGAPEHMIGKHLVGAAWVAETIELYGEDSPYVQAKVFARFPKGGPSRVLPTSWLENALDAEEPEVEVDGEWVRLSDLRLPDETAEWAARRGSWVRLGVDVAADGGDELVVCRLVGDLQTIEHATSGPANANPYDVAGVVLRQILRADALRRALGTEAPVRVKIDAIGVGWGVAGILTAWASEGVHAAQIVPVVVSESTGRPDDTSTMRPWRKRDEMWLAFRALISPAAAGSLRMRVDRKRTLAQLASPTYGTNSSGHTVIESKRSLRERGLSSPDRAEAALLAVYEPAPPVSKRRKVAVLGQG